MYTAINGDKYEGKWENNFKEGNGKEYIKEKDEYYEGNFSCGQRDGEGKLVDNHGYF